MKGILLITAILTLGFPAMLIAGGNGEAAGAKVSDEEISEDVREVQRERSELASERSGGNRCGEGRTSSYAFSEGRPFINLILLNFPDLNQVVSQGILDELGLRVNVQLFHNGVLVNVYRMG